MISTRWPLLQLLVNTKLTTTTDTSTTIVTPLLSRLWSAQSRSILLLISPLKARNHRWAPNSDLPPSPVFGHSNIPIWHGAAKAACPQRVIACLMELQVDFELIPVDLDSAEHKSPAFLSRQPFGQVPVIEDGDFRLYGMESESAAKLIVAAWLLRFLPLARRWIETAQAQVL